MNLHEQYQALIARGMPEHPRLHLCDGLWSLHESVEEYGDDGALDDADARDLVTMHAMRWMRKRETEQDPLLASMVDAVPDLDPIETILMMTKHLETKG